MRGGDCTYTRLVLLAAALLIAGAACGGDGGSKKDLRIERPSAEGFELLEAIIAGLPDDISDPTREDEILAEATEGQRVIWALWVVDGEVGNGGFEQFFFNSSGSLMDDAIDAAGAVGASTQERILRQAAAIYPNGHVPEDRDERDRILQSMPEREVHRVLGPLNERWYAADRSLERKMVAYVEENPDDFFS